MLSRHIFCCYILFTQRVTLTLVRVTYFTHYTIYNFSIYLLFLSVICVGLHSVVDIFEPMYSGFESLETHFLSLLLQCKFVNSTLLSLLSLSYFITPYDAQASSAFSALILSGIELSSRISQKS